MAVIAGIAVAITAKTDKFTKGCKDAQSSLDSFADGVAGGVAKVAAFGAALTGAAAAGLVALTAHAFESVSKQVDLADRLEISTSKLRELSYASEQAGGSAEGFASALEKMNVNIGQAEQGSEADIKAFDALGISVQELAKNDAAQNFELITKRLGEIPDSAQRAASAAAIFGKGGGKDVLLMAGSISEATSRFKMLSGDLSSFDASEIEKAGDSFGDLKVMIFAVGEQFAKNLAPLIIHGIDLFIEWGATGENIAQAVAQSFAFMKSVLADVVVGIAKYVQFVSKISPLGKILGWDKIDPKAIEESLNAFGKGAVKKQDERREKFIGPSAPKIPALITEGDGKKKERLKEEHDIEEAFMKGYTDSLLRDEKIKNDQFNEQQAFEQKVNDMLDERKAKIEEIGAKWKKAANPGLEELKSNLMEIEQSFKDGQLTMKEAQAADLKAREEFANSQPDKKQLTGGQFQSFDLSRVNLAALSAQGVDKEQRVKAPDVVAAIEKVRQEISKQNMPGASAQ